MTGMADADFDDRGIVTTCPACGQKNRFVYERLGDPVRCGTCKAPLHLPAEPIEMASAADFDRLVSRSSVPVLVDYWAPWCGPCRMVAPVMEEIAQERGDQLKVVKLNIDENQNTAIQFNVMSIPTLILFRNGQPAKTVIGAYPKRKLVEELEPALA